MGRIGLKHTVLVRSTYGKMQIDIHRTDAREQPRWLWSTWPHPFGLVEPNLGGWWRSGGFSYAVGGTQGGNTVRQITVPYWSLILLSLLLSIALLLGRPSQQSDQQRSWKHFQPLTTLSVSPSAKNDSPQQVAQSQESKGYAVG